MNNGLLSALFSKIHVFLPGIPAKGLDKWDGAIIIGVKDSSAVWKSTYPYQEWRRERPDETTATCVSKVPNPAETDR